MPTRAPERWDLVCRVVDNFGDAGVTLRLARELAAEHGRAVRLWIDQPAVVARLAPELAARGRMDAGDGYVELHDIAAMTPGVVAGDVIVEAFGGGVPELLLTAMLARAVAPQWFVLEYLSAEAWPETIHGLRSQHPQLPLVRRYWCPGFTPGTGGLLRERDLLARRDAFVRDRSAGAALMRALGVPPAEADRLDVSLFSYPHAPLAALLEALAHGSHRVRLLVPEGIGNEALRAWAGQAIAPGVAVARGSLDLRGIPFVPQDRYDELLWACDLNFVRGEDSFVRAQWAARPLLWHIYPQAEQAHVPKLEAFVQRYAASLGSAACDAWRGGMRAWNGLGDLGPAWAALAAALPALKAHAEGWAEALRRTPELARTLVEAASNRL